MSAGRPEEVAAGVTFRPRPGATKLTKMTVARVNDIALYYEVHGQGPPLLLIPGLASDVGLFGGVTGTLVESRQVVAFDPRGAGRSDKPDIPYSIEGMADDAAALLELLEIPKTTVVGYSMGGRIAMSLALYHPHLVGRLVLAATSAHVPPISSLDWRSVAMEMLGRIPRPRRVTPQPRYAFRRQRQASRNFDCSKRLGEIKAPTLVLHGRNDHIVPLSLAHELHIGIPDSRFVTVRGGHMALVTTQRHSFITEIQAFTEPQ
jgi:pimeloyl-ACP methyl ester carboxylesterase